MRCKRSIHSLLASYWSALLMFPRSAFAAETECVEGGGCDDVGSVGEEGRDFHEGGALGASRASRDKQGELCMTETRVCIQELKTLDPVIARIVPDLVGD